jgi:hypothetical protein
MTLPLGAAVQQGGIHMKTCGLSLICAFGVCVASTSLAARSAGAQGPAAAMPVPTWDRQIEGPRRFRVLKDFDDEAVLDRETGLVWERFPSDLNGDQVITIPDDEADWIGARGACVEKDVGNRKGWRLPAIYELLSLIDPSVPDAPKLPDGHPFIDVQSPGNYWSATTDALEPEIGGCLPSNPCAWSMDFFGNATPAGQKVTFAFVWCVRGGSPGRQLTDRKARPPVGLCAPDRVA